MKISWTENDKWKAIPNNLTILNNYRMSTYIKNQTGGILDSTNICWVCPCVWSGELSRAVSPATHYGSFNWKVSSVPFYQHSFIRLMAFIISEIFCLKISQLSPCLQPPDCKFLLCRLCVKFEKNFLCIHLSRCLIIIKDKLQCVNLIPENVSSLEELYSLNRFAGD